ncbi:peptidase family M49-domain-containing protein [Kalaharituber pfeilii]|nr:peptidase family M49-domain-containing protein [Kalaharituber pfeilii]
MTEIWFFVRFTVPIYLICFATHLAESLHIELHQTLKPSILRFSQAQSYLADSPPTICRLEVEPHFSNLQPNEKLYAHYISRAAFLGTRITMRQISPESEAIYDLIVGLYKAVEGDWDKLGKEIGVDPQNMKLWLEYAACFLGNAGNYKSFGDEKFIPRIPKEELKKLAAYTTEMNSVFESIQEAMYSTIPDSRNLLGYPDAGHLSTYYPNSPDITKQEIEAIQSFMIANALLPENTRLSKVEIGGAIEYHLLKASAFHSATEGEILEYNLPTGTPLEGRKLKIIYGDHSKEMEIIVANIDKAVQYAANDTQRSMLAEYSKSFRIGSLEAHKESQKYWVKDIGPKVETNLGFIETYRDPAGVRGEWEGFVAMVNEERTRAFGELVKKAEEFIPRLPWGKELEKDKFLKPDFTSLEVLTFAGSGIPAGINIPNYDDIRQTIGFKNVSLGNVLSAKAPNERITFIREQDVPMYEKLRGPAFEVQVGLHELLGHGTGKLLSETSPGEYNFDINSPPINPLTGEKVKTWYKLGETWGSVFGGIAASYEECRAECVAMYLGGDADILEIFGFGENSDIKGDDVLYIEYLSMARAGLLALEQWDPRSKKWGQAHMQARFSILKSLLQAGDGFVTLSSAELDHDDLVVVLDRSKIKSHGKPAVGKYLQKLSIYKSIADVDAGTKLYAEMTEVDETMAEYRDVVLRKKQPRKNFVEANTFIKENGEVELKHYEATCEGLIQSYAERDL